MSTIHEVCKDCSQSRPRNRKKIQNLYRGTGNCGFAVGYPADIAGGKEAEGV